MDPSEPENRRYGPGQAALRRTAGTRPGTASGRGGSGHEFPAIEPGLRALPADSPGAGKKRRSVGPGPGGRGNESLLCPSGGPARPAEPAFCGGTAPALLAESQNPMGRRVFCTDHTDILPGPPGSPLRGTGSGTGPGDASHAGSPLLESGGYCRAVHRVVPEPGVFAALAAYGVPRGTGPGFRTLAAGLSEGRAALDTGMEL